MANDRAIIEWNAVLGSFPEKGEGGVYRRAWSPVVNPT